MSPQTTLFTFFVRASGGPEVASISSAESWIAQARQRTNSPDAEVVLIEQKDWDAPNLTSYDDAYLRSNFPLIVKGIQKSLISRGVPEIPPQELLNKIEVMGSPLTRLLVLVVKYTGTISPPKAQKKSWLSNLFGKTEKYSDEVKTEVASEKTTVTTAVEAMIEVRKLLLEVKSASDLILASHKAAERLTQASAPEGVVASFRKLANDAKMYTDDDAKYTVGQLANNLTNMIDMMKKGADALQ